MSASTSRDQALLEVSNLTWQKLEYPTNGKVDRNSEQGWTLLPGYSGNVLTVGPEAFEIFDSVQHHWTYQTFNLQLFGSYPSADEVGPAIQLPNGQILATGAGNGAGNITQQPRPGNTAIFDTMAGWTAGPSFPDMGGVHVGMGDETAVALPGGNILLAAHDVASPGSYYLMEHQYQNQANPFCTVAAPADITVNAPSSSLHMLLLPTGKVLVTSHSPRRSGSQSTYYIYTPGSHVIDPSWRPMIVSLNHGLTRGAMYKLTGLRLNGISQGVAFGDEYQNSTNYALVQITNTSTGKVVYAKTHDSSRMAIATGSNTVSTWFDVPSAADPGSSTLVVTSNGIASNPPYQVTIN